MKDYYKSLTNDELNEIRKNHKSNLKLIYQVLKERYTKDYLEKNDYQRKYREKKKSGN